jgi:hypothetical protein
MKNAFLFVVFSTGDSTAHTHTKILITKNGEDCESCYEALPLSLESAGVGGATPCTSASQNEYEAVVRMDSRHATRRPPFLFFLHLLHPSQLALMVLS